jgi:class 3 adenylate cyclase
MLNDLFSRFDYLVGLYDLNKVKTIGDCYMVSSIPSSDIEYDGCARVCRFALDLMKAVKDFNDSGPQQGPITLRVGISLGAVVAGVVGTKRYLFDVWGDAVNVAARMEQHGVPGQIQVTQDVVLNAGSDFSFESRGVVSVLALCTLFICCIKSHMYNDIQITRSKLREKGPWKDSS